MKITQSQVDNYVNGALSFYPAIKQGQLTDMVILHFDIPAMDAKRMVGKALEQTWQFSHTHENEPYHNRFTGEIM